MYLAHNAVPRSKVRKGPTGILRLYLELSSFTGISFEDASDTPLSDEDCCTFWLLSQILD
jgi:hypothetical protein